MNTEPRIIDVHHHFEPTGKNAGGEPWTIAMALDQLDRNGVAAAIAYGGPVFGSDAQAVSNARRINEWATTQCNDHGGRFGLFASLAFENVDAALTEIAYAFDVLKADGIGLSPVYDGRWLGDATFRPILEELNRRGAVVYVHPARGCSPFATLNDEHGLISAAWIEFPSDTARTILSLWAAGATLAFPDIQWLFCHGGGVMPILLGRIAGFTGWHAVGPDRLNALFPDGIYAAFARLHFELAQAYAPETYAMLRSIVPATQFLYGSDYSYFQMAHSLERFEALAMPASERAMIASGNAGRLLPRWAT
jgi:predicted TIM-barrel fold metal-dependent hydrolase